MATLKKMAESHKTETKTTRYDVAEHLRTPEKMAVFVEA